MYNHSHLYMTSKITGSTNPLLLFGSLLPDFHHSQTLPPQFDHQVMQLMQFLKDKHPDLVPLTLGMTLHEYPIGVDRFIHQSYKGGPGYAFQFNDQLAQLTQETLNTDPQTTHLLTHFLVENAIEYKISNQHPETNDLLLSCRSVDKGHIVDALSEFYHADKSTLLKEWEIFDHTAYDYDYSSYLGLGKVWAEVRKRLFNETIDPQVIADLIKFASKTIKPTVESFLAETITACRKDFQYNFPSYKEQI
ncbi:hypothetical protein ACFL0V_02845 [Nanoarchaeota archaeon]